MPNDRAVEICVTDVASACAASAGGADRLELCADLASGGVTPSAGMIARVVERAGIAAHVLIRPRGGDFVYLAAELDVMAADIRGAIGLGASGVVIGALGPDGRVDRAAIRRLIAEARPSAVTFHRAIDRTADPLATLDVLIELGVDRVLTSGGPGPARGNVSALCALVGRASGRIEVMVGGGVTEADLPRLLDRTGASAVHLNSGVTGPAPAPGPFGSSPNPVEADRVRRVVRRVKG